MVDDEKVLDDIRRRHDPVHIRMGDDPEHPSEVLLPVAHAYGIVTGASHHPSRMIRGEDRELAVAGETFPSLPRLGLTENDLGAVDPYLGNLFENRVRKGSLQVKAIIAYGVFHHPFPPAFFMIVTPVATEL